MTQSDFNRLLETAWARHLTADEEAQLHAWFDQQPDALPLWQDEVSLNAILNDLPDAPVPSNFTALVLGDVDRHLGAVGRSSRWAIWLMQFKTSWMPRLAAVALLVVCLALASQRYYSFKNQQASNALVWLSVAASSVPEPQVFKDFDAIRRLGQTTPPNDDALFTVLNQ